MTEVLEQYNWINPGILYKCIVPSKQFSMDAATLDAMDATHIYRDHAPFYVHILKTVELALTYLEKAKWINPCIPAWESNYYLIYYILDIEEDVAVLLLQVFLKEGTNTDQPIMKICSVGTIFTY